jgi:hypothetical protein
MKLSYALGLLFVSIPAIAHEGHGLFGSHWHATDALGFVGAAAAAVLAIWWLKK